MELNKLNTSYIMVCPLNWGIGHASRCVPIINLLLKQKKNIIIASDGKALMFLKMQFPNLKSIELPAYNVTYPQKGFFFLILMCLQIPKILYAIYKEHACLKKIAKNNNIELIISDNRYGLWHAKVKSVFITHQLMIKVGNNAVFAENILHKIIKKFISNFSECWIPDFEGAVNLSGDLSHKYPLPPATYFINPLSRFDVQKIENTLFIYDICVILSGPEPQRSIFEQKILSQIKDKNLKIALVRGLPGDTEVLNVHTHTKVFNHLDSEALQSIIMQSKHIVARSGYSTIMDLVCLGKTALLVPTSGQTEQEYLASYHKKLGLFEVVTQKKININMLPLDSLIQNNIKMSFNEDIIEKRLSFLLN